jgi:hypothetical protein
MATFEMMARKHWPKYLPEMTRQLKEAGTYEETLMEAVDQAKSELARRVSRGEHPEIVKEDVAREYILLDPETEEED